MSFFKKLKNVASAVSTVRSVTNALSSNNPVGTLASSAINRATRGNTTSVSYTHLRAHET